jgi:hypothetical protein
VFLRMSRNKKEELDRGLQKLEERVEIENKTCVGQ